jgi:hypothetical protein
MQGGNILVALLEQPPSFDDTPAEAEKKQE